MLRSSAALLLLAAAAALAQNAPVTRSAPHHPLVTEPVAGFRIVSDAPLATVSNSADTVELRLEHGRATVHVDHPAPGTLLLLDAPTGQVDFTHDGMYTINADTGILRVLRGEAEAFPPNAPEDAQGTAVREGEQVTLAESLRPAPSHDLRADLIQSGPGWPEHYDYSGAYPAYGYAEGPAWGWDPWFYSGWGWPGWGWGPYYAWGWDPWLFPGWGWGFGISRPFGFRGYAPIYPRRFPGGFASPGRPLPPRTGGYISRAPSPGFRPSPGFHPAPGGSSSGGGARGFHGGGSHR